MVESPKMGSRSQQVLDALAGVIRGRNEMSSLAGNIAASRNDKTVRVPDVLLAALAWEARTTRRASKEARQLTEPPDRRTDPGYLAWRIVAGPGTIAEKRERLRELERQHPGDMGVLGYFESLAMQEDLEQQARKDG